MEKWEKNELKAFELFKQNVDSQATYTGGSNSTEADIYSPKLCGYVEVKTLDKEAFGGQFTATTAIYPVCQKVLNGEVTAETAKEFSKAHYADRKVKQFITIKDDEISFYDFQTFFEKFNFDWQIRRKKSETREVPKKDVEAIVKQIPGGVYEQDGKWFVNDESLAGQYFNINGANFFISSRNCGEVRKCSNTNNMTYHVVIKEK